MASLPGGTVTFLLTDIEASTRRLQQFGEEYRDVVRDHRRLLREHLGAKDGAAVDTQGMHPSTDPQGDASFYPFARARDADAGESSFSGKGKGPGEGSNVTTPMKLIIDGPGLVVLAILVVIWLIRHIL